MLDVAQWLVGAHLPGYGLQCIKNKLAKPSTLIITVDGDVAYLRLFRGVKVNTTASHDIPIVVDNYAVLTDLLVLVFFRTRRKVPGLTQILPSKMIIRG